MENPLDKASLQNKGTFEGEAIRLHQLYGFYKHISHGNIDTSNIWVGKMIFNSELYALAALLIEKGIITADDFLSKATEFISQEIDKVQKEHDIIIASDGVYQKRSKGNTNGGTNSKKG